MEEIFRKYGKISDLKFNYDYRDEKKAIITFKNVRDAQYAYR